MCGGGNIYNCIHDLLGVFFAPAAVVGAIGLAVAPLLITPALARPKWSQAAYLAGSWPKLALLQRVNAVAWLLAWLVAIASAFSLLWCGFACFFAVGLPLLTLPTCIGIGIFLFGPNPASRGQKTRPQSNERSRQ